MGAVKTVAILLSGLGAVSMVSIANEGELFDSLQPILKDVGGAARVNDAASCREGTDDLAFPEVNLQYCPNARSHWSSCCPGRFFGTIRMFQSHKIPPQLFGLRSEAFRLRY